MEAVISVFDPKTHSYCYRCKAVVVTALHVHTYSEYVWCPECGRPTADGHGHPFAGSRADVGR